MTRPELGILVTAGGAASISLLTSGHSDCCCSMTGGEGSSWCSGRDAIGTADFPIAISLCVCVCVYTCTCVEYMFPHAWMCA